MARVLLLEPHADINALLELVVSRLGHEAVMYAGGGVDDVAADVAVVEPAEVGALQLSARLRTRGVPLVFTSIFPPSAEAIALEPVAYLVKPFPLSRLRRELRAVLEPEVAAA